MISMVKYLLQEDRTQFGNPVPRHGWKIIEVEDEQESDRT